MPIAVLGDRVPKSTEWVHDEGTSEAMARVLSRRMERCGIIAVRPDRSMRLLPVLLALVACDFDLNLPEPDANPPPSGDEPSNPANEVSAAEPAASVAAAPKKPIAKGWVDLGDGRHVRASSTLASKSGSLYAATNLIDGDPGTNWVEGASGVGKGEWIEVFYEEAIALDAILLRPGFVASVPQLVKNATPKTLTLRLEDRPVQARVVGQAFSTTDAGLEDEPHITDHTGIDDCRLTDDPRNLAPRLFFLTKPLDVHTIRLTIDEAYSPGKDLDTVLAEMTPIPFADVEQGPVAVPGHPGLDRLLLVFRELRGGRLSAERVAPGARVAKLSDPRVTLMGGWGGQVVDATGPEEINAFARASRKGALQESFGAVETLPDGGMRYTGGVKARDGDGEWIEAYPVIELDAEGRVRLATDAIRTDGAPGCTDTWGLEIRK